MFVRKDDLEERIDNLAEKLGYIRVSKNAFTSPLISGGIAEDVAQLKRALGDTLNDMVTLAKTLGYEKKYGPSWEKVKKHGK